jgi:hypothetical protein
MLDISYGAVKQIWQRYKKSGFVDLSPRYDRCGKRSRSAEAALIYEKALWFREQHPTWGANRIHVSLQDLYGAQAPSVRSLQKWYRTERLTAPRMRHNEPFIGQSRAVHNIWQVDAKEQLVLQDGQLACYLTFTDEYSGAWLGSIAFAHHRINQVPVLEVRAACIRMFMRWGKAGSLRVDNGEPFGNPKMNSTSALALWLIAIDVDMIWNKPHSPTQNAKVERAQGTSSRWVEIAKCENLATLQRRLDEESEVHRAKLLIRRLDNRTRLAVYPELETSRRTFEQDFLDIGRVHAFLAQKTYIRKVSQQGQISLYSQLFSVGLPHKGKKIEIKFNVADLTWSFYDHNNLLSSAKALNFSKESICNLSVFLPPTQAAPTEP